MAANINKENLWSNSLTKNALTTYAEGLACKNFDQRIIYNVRRHSSNVWFVLKKEAGLNPPTLDQSQKLYYDRVRRVTLDPELNMSCSCGYIQRYLMPCPHMCAVVDHPEYMVPSMYHIKWHKIFNYYHATSFGPTLASNVCNTLDEALKITRQNSFRSSGKYKGVPLVGTSYLNSLTQFVDIDFCVYDPVYDLMMRIQNQTNEFGPVIKNTVPFNLILSNIVDNYVSELPFHGDFSDNAFNSYGGLSQVEFHLSQDRVHMNDSFDHNLIPYNKYHKEALPLFEEMVSSCRNDCQFNEMMELMRTQHMKHVISKGINAYVGQKTGTLLFGEDNTNCKNEKRHKFLHERHGHA